MHRTESGFTVIELLIALTITVAIMTAVLTAVDLNANITRVQSDVSDLQQSIRVAQRDLQRLVRMTGRGGFPLAVQEVTGGPTGHYLGRALQVEQGAHDLDIGGEKVVENTDVLTIRGAFTSPVYRIDASDPVTFQVAGNTATLQIDSITPSAFEQPLSAFHALYDDGAGALKHPEAILLVGSQGDAVYAVVEMTNLQFQTVNLDVQHQARTVERAILTLSIDANAGGHAADYLELSKPSPTEPEPHHIPADLTAIAFATVLEEYRFFIREDFAIPGDDTSLPSPKLSRARVVPNTSPPALHPDGAIDIADNVFDLQVALGIDVDGNGRVDVEDAGGAPLAANADEWLWNDPEDNPLGWDAGSLHYVRLTILGRAQTADRQYISPAVTDIENRDYDEPASPTDPAQIVERRHRRRLLQSTIDLRNL